LEWNQDGQAGGGVKRKKGKKFNRADEVLWF